MNEVKCYIPDGTLFASGFNRVVHGGRGDYVEFEENQILLPLLCKYENDISDSEQDIYYWWLYPEGYPDIKVYLQRRCIKYADYKIGKYYVSPDLLKNFKDPEKLF